MSEPQERSITKPLEVKEATEIAEFYKLPLTLVNMMFVIMGNVAYPKEAFLLYQGHKRGILRIEVDEPKLEKREDGENEWHTEARIYPRVSPEILQTLIQYPPDERKLLITEFTKPTQEWGRASKKNVRMSTMQEWLPELAIKRAVCRALRLFAGVGATSFEEMPEVVVSNDELRSARDITISKPKDGKLEGY